MKPEQSHVSEIGELKSEATPRILLPDEQLGRLREMGLENLAKGYERAIEVCMTVKERGGRALLVGGSVRDMFVGKISKDFDLEVYGLPAKEVEEIVKSLGKLKIAGKDFGVLKLPVGDGIDIDVSLPRRDSKTTEGDWDINTDPYMSIEEAARRRDFTMNSLAADPLTGEVFDYFGGIKDLREGILKVTDPEKFGEDALRVMRGLQFIGRFGLQLDGETARLMIETSADLKKKSKERLYEEWRKMLLKSPKPSIALSAGLALGIFHEIHPEIPPLEHTPQEPEWHPEGNAWIHTLMAVDKAAEIARREELDTDQAWVIMLAALAHDFGKPVTTELDEWRWKSHGHDQAGVEPAAKFLETLGVDKATTAKVLKLVADHLAPGLLYVNEKVKGQKVSDGAIRRLAERIHPATIQELVMVAEADHTGRGPFVDPEIPEQLLLPEGYPAGKWMLDRARAIDVDKSKPIALIQGRAFMQLGFRQGEHIGLMMKLANRLRDEKEFTADMVFAAIDGIKDKDEVLVKLESLL